MGNESSREQPDAASDTTQFQLDRREKQQQEQEDNITLKHGSTHTVTHSHPHSRHSPTPPLQLSSGTHSDVLISYLTRGIQLTQPQPQYQQPHQQEKGASSHRDGTRAGAVPLAARVIAAQPAIVAQSSFINTATPPSLGAPPSSTSQDFLLLRTQLETITSQARRKQQLEHDRIQSELILKYQQDSLRTKQQFEAQDLEIRRMLQVQQTRVDELEQGNQLDMNMLFPAVAASTSQRKKRPPNKRSKSAHPFPPLVAISVATRAEPALSVPQQLLAMPTVTDSPHATTSSAAQATTGASQHLDVTMSSNPSIPSFHSNSSDWSHQENAFAVQPPWTPSLFDENTMRVSNVLEQQLYGQHHHFQQQHEQTCDMLSHCLEEEEAVLLVEDIDTIPRSSSSSSGDDTPPSATFPPWATATTTAPSLYSTHASLVCSTGHKSLSAIYLENYKKNNILQKLEREYQSGSFSNTAVRSLLMWFITELDQDDQSSFLESFSHLNLAGCSDALFHSCSHLEIHPTSEIPCCMMRAPPQWGGEWMREKRRKYLDEPQHFHHKETHEKLKRVFEEIHSSSSSSSDGDSTASITPLTDEDLTLLQLDSIGSQLLAPYFSKYHFSSRLSDSASGRGAKDLSSDQPCEDDLDGVARLSLMKIGVHAREMDSNVKVRVVQKRKKSSDGGEEEDQDRDHHADATPLSFHPNANNNPATTNEPTTHLHRIVSVNRAYEALTGYTQSDIVRLHAKFDPSVLIAHVRKDHIKGMHALIGKFKLQRATEVHMYQVRHRADGSLFYALVHMKLSFSQGLFLGCVESILPLPKDQPMPPFQEGVDLDESVLLFGYHPEN